MKTILYLFSLFFFILITPVIYAGDSTLISSYPAPGGSYNQLNFSAPAHDDLSTPVSCTASNAGQLYWDASQNTLALCATNNSGGSQYPVAIPAGETCFNQFCSTTDGSLCAPACPTGYSAPAPPIQDQFLASAGYTVTSNLCCYGHTANIVSQTS